MNDLGIANMILDIRIVQNNNGIILTQLYYIENLLKKFDHFDCKPMATHFDSNLKLYTNTGRAVYQLEYDRVIKFLMYVMILDLILCL